LTTASVARLPAAPVRFHQARNQVGRAADAKSFEDAHGPYRKVGRKGKTRKRQSRRRDRRHT
jgi:hypothetical protein